MRNTEISSPPIHQPFRKGEAIYIQETKLSFETQHTQLEEFQRVIAVFESQRLQYQLKRQYFISKSQLSISKTRFPILCLNALWPRIHSRLSEGHLLAVASAAHAAREDVPPPTNDDWSYLRMYEPFVEIGFTSHLSLSGLVPWLSLVAWYLMQ